MEYRKVGKWGLKVSELGLGSWLTFGKQVNVEDAREALMKAFESGVNFFDTAEAYGNGVAEFILGQALKAFRREDIVVSTKIFWGGTGPNDKGLSRKHIVEGLRNSLKRLEIDYVDIVYCHRPDPEVPLEETVLAMDFVVRNGLSLYWGTSEWSKEQIEKAHMACRELNCIEPIVEQPQYNMFVRTKVESEFLPLYEKYGTGLTTWSPLASGVLTGKYNDGIPAGSRLDIFPDLRKTLEEEGILTDKTFAKLKGLQKIADELKVKLSQLGIAWCLKNPHVSSVILGVSNVSELKENLAASEIKNRIDEELMHRIDDILKG